MVEIKIKSSAPKDEHFKFYKYVIFAILAIIVLYLVVTLIKVNASCEEGVDYTCPVCEECEVCEVCEVCEEDIIYRNVTREITIYVCEDGTEVDVLEDCFPESSKLPPIDTIDTNEEGTQIISVNVEPACVSGHLGGYVSYDVVSPAENVRYLVKEEHGDYKEMLEEKGYFNSYREFLICDPTCGNIRHDFKLDSGKRYLLKIEFDRTTLYGVVEYSNEYVIDLTGGSNFMTKGC